MRTFLSTKKTEGRNGWFHIQPEKTVDEIEIACDVCEKKYRYTEVHTFYQNIPSIDTETIGYPDIEERRWGIRGKAFHCCGHHTDFELRQFERKKESDSKEKKGLK